MRLGDDWRNAPGPGDLDPGPSACLGGACPHDHSAPRDCVLCDEEFESEGEEVCTRCEPLLHKDIWELAWQVRHLEQHIETTERQRA